MPGTVSSRISIGGIDVEVVRSKRRTMALQVKDGRALVRAPLRMPRGQIESFVREHRAWIEKHLRLAAEKAGQRADVDMLTAEQIQGLAAEALRDLPERAARFAPLVGVSYGRIAIRLQKTRWGSCSSKGNLNFNCLLMLAPQDVRDYVVVHELCHRKEMNHSPRFWAEVERVLPAYRSSKKWLKDNGGLLMARAGLA